MTLLSRYDLGDTTTTTDEPSSTSTETPVTDDQVSIYNLSLSITLISIQITTVFVIAVEEVGWRQNHYDNQEFQDATWSIMTE